MTATHPTSGTPGGVFQLEAELPGHGVTVLEASAGTGKTYAVAALAARYVAEGVVPLERLLVITFSRAATQELRDRVRATFTAAAEALRTGEPGAHPALHAALTTVEGRPASDEERQQRRERLLEAVAGYDAASIATTHEFCQTVLRSLGVAGSSDAGERLSESVSDLARDVVADRYLATYAGDAQPLLTHRDARRVAEAALENPQAELRPAPSDPGTETGGEGDGGRPSRAEALVGFARGVRDEVELRKRRAGVFTFDDVLTRLADAVAAEPGDDFAAERMRARLDVVLVDEFQDTDATQWQVLARGFGPQTRLVLIGDPKQAIYGFRGGDVPTYLAAVEGSPMQTLSENWRSDAAVVDGLRVLTRGARLGDERIVVRHVEARRTGSSLSARGGVQLRQVRREGFRLTKSGTVSIGPVREHIARDVAAEIADLLASGLTYDDGSGRGPRPLEAGDVAVLLHSVREEAPRIQAELRLRGVSSVLNAPESVMLSEAAGHWQRLLEAMEKPQLPGRVRAAALTPFFATSATDLDAGGDDLTDTLAERVRAWLDLFRSRGVAAVASAAHAAGMAERVLGHEGGERLLTDLQHVGQLLHEVVQRDRLGLSGLLAWFREAVDEGNRDDSRRRRLDVDAAAVQFATIHGSKGLEYPVVFLPQLFDRSVKDWPTIHAYHEGDVRCLDVADGAEAKEAARREDAEEELRLAYVALTRARARVVAWWAPTWNAGNGPLTRLLFGRTPDEPVVAARAPVGSTDDEVDAVLSGWAAAGAFELVPSEVGEAVVAASAPSQRLGARAWAREVDTDWRRTSYSGLIRAEEQSLATATSEPERGGTDDEDLPGAGGEVAGDEPVGDDAGARVEIAPALLSPMNGLPAGAAFGSLVHAVLEQVDPEAADLRAEVLAAVEEQRRWWPVHADSDDLAEALLPLQSSPLGPLVDGLSLGEITLRDRLSELDFELPLGGGEGAGRESTPAGGSRLLGEVADVMERHLGADDPVLAYAERLRTPSLAAQVLRGYLSGSIDVVLRVGEPGAPRYVVVDYKTNTLGTPGEPLSAWDYTPALVTEAMLHSHYPLQAMLYSVALHRFLRWRQAAYDPEVHLGGVLYLYVRGMVGPDTPVVDDVPCGVFSWKPPAAMVVELSDLLDGFPRSATGDVS